MLSNCEYDMSVDTDTFCENYRLCYRILYFEVSLIYFFEIDVIKTFFSHAMNGSTPTNHFAEGHFSDFRKFLKNSRASFFRSYFLRKEASLAVPVHNFGTRRNREIEVILAKVKTKINQNANQK